MLSKFLWILERGVIAIRHHTKFIFLGLLLLIVPMLLLFYGDRSNQIILQNTETSQKETIAVLHQALWQMPGTITETVRESSLLSELNSPTNQWVYTDSNSDEPDYASNPGAREPAATTLEVTPVGSTPFIFTDTVAGERTWYAISKQVEDGQVRVLVTEHNFSELDQLLENRLQDTLYIAILIVLLLLAVAFWLIRQINWQSKYQELDKQLAEQTKLIASITHEFRAPLTAMRGYLSFLFESNRLRTKDKDSLVRISLSNERMLALVNDFLEAATLQSGRTALTTEKVSVSAVVYKAISELGTQAADKKLVLRDGTKSSDIALVTDAARLQQVLVNLINNAIKYTERGSVVITYEENPLYVTIRVQDTGAGITAEEQAKLFTPFVRVGGSVQKAQVGSGLGMWISKKLTELLGGEISVESIAGVGTHVVLRFSKRQIAAKIKAGIL